MNARRLTCLLTAAVCGLALASCGSVRERVVTVLAPWLDGSPEQRSFEAITDEFTRRTGIRVSFTGARDVDTVLESDLRDGDPPDLAALSTPGRMRQLATAGAVVPLDRILGPDRMREQYDQQWIDLTTATDASGDSAVYAVVVKASVKSLIWYDPRTLPASVRSELARPGTNLDDLAAISRDLAAAGTPTWCLGVEDSSHSGWPGTDWIEDILLHQAGPGAYDRWIDGDLAWTSREVRTAWETWGELVLADGLVRDDVGSVLTTNFSAAGAALFTDPPGCYLEHGASFLTGYYQDHRLGRGSAHHPRPGRDFDFAPFPGGVAPGAQEVAGDLMGMFRDTPAARELITYLTTPEAQEHWVRSAGSGAISANKLVPMTAYPDPVSRRVASMILTASAVRFDASDSMPQILTTAFEHSVLSYLEHPERLGDILRDLDQVSATAYPAGR